VSGPLLDRIDLHLEVTPVSLDAVVRQHEEEPSRVIRQRVEDARVIQADRFNDASLTNARMTNKDMKTHCLINADCQKMIRMALENLGLSARAFNRILKVSRTIADLDKSENIEIPHMAEAIQYRSLDRESWGG
jgi:magnesium chelatase family protein